MMTKTERADPVCIGVLTCDPLRLDGMRALLEGEGQYCVLPLTTTEVTGAPSPRLAVVDADSVINLESLVRQMRRARPHLAILVLGPNATFDRVMEIVAFGAKGYLPYTAAEAEFRMALKVVEEGSIWAPRKVLALLLAQRAAEPKVPPKLTRREDQVLRLLMQGRPNRQIAEALEVDEATVKAHLGRMMRKLGVRNRIALSMVVLDTFPTD